MTITKKSKEFIEKYVFNNMGYTEINDDNIAEIIDYIVDNIEVPLAQAKEAGDSIDEDMLNAATSVVAEITSNPEW